jgi:hypothetical protein
LRAASDTDPEQVAETSLNIADRSPERRRLALGDDLLGRIARISGGTARTLSPEAPFPPEIHNPELRRPVDRRVRPLWPTWAWLAALVLALTSEWWLRRASGLR